MVPSTRAGRCPHARSRSVAGEVESVDDGLEQRVVRLGHWHLASGGDRVPKGASGLRPERAADSWRPGDGSHSCHRRVTFERTA